MSTRRLHRSCWIINIALIGIVFTLSPLSAQEKKPVVDQSNQLPWKVRTAAHRQDLDRGNSNGPIVNANLPQSNSELIPASFLMDEETNNAGPQNNGSDQEDSTSADSQSGKTPSGLPNSAGQVWREYDISSYTSKITTTQSPQQAVVDWILKETGTEMWFNEPLGILSASRTRLRVYHTPEIQAVVKRIVDQLIQSQGRVQLIGLKVVTVGNPNWRTTALKMMQPIRVQSPGVQGWMVSKENAAVLFGQLRNRGDFRVIKSGNLSIHDGQQLALSQLKPINYFESVQSVTNQYGLTQWQPVTQRIHEGFQLEIGAATSNGQRTIETVLNCQVDQVEKLQPVRIHLPVQGNQQQAVEIQVPQMISWRLKERFRWPSDQVLVLSCGVVATPNPDGNGGMDFGKFLSQSRGRADAILFIEYKGPAQTSRVPGRPETNHAIARQPQGMRPVGPKR